MCQIRETQGRITVGQFFVDRTHGRGRKFGPSRSTVFDFGNCQSQQTQVGQFAKQRKIELFLFIEGTCLRFDLVMDVCMRTGTTVQLIQKTTTCTSCATKDRNVARNAACSDVGFHKVDKGVVDRNRRDNTSCLLRGRTICVKSMVHNYEINSVSDAKQS